MKVLENTVIKNGFTYNLICRTDKYALYEQIDRDGLIAGHEMGLLKQAKAKLVFDKEMPDREVFFSNEDFGVTAWSVGMDRDLAIEKFSTIEDRFKEK